MTETKKITVTLPAALAAQLQQEAAATDATNSTVVKYALEEYLVAQQRARDFALEDACRE